MSSSVQPVLSPLVFDPLSQLYVSAVAQEHCSALDLIVGKLAQTSPRQVRLPHSKTQAFQCLDTESGL
jgi:hypothetical protein